MVNSTSKDKTKESFILSWLPEKDTNKNEADKKIKDAILKNFRQLKLPF